MAQWRPAERIRHDARGGAWPTQAEAMRSRLFSPLQLGPLRLPNRTWIPAMVPWRASEDGMVTPEILEWYERFARGKPAVIVVEATGIADVASGPLLRISHDGCIPGLTALSRVVREASGGETRLFIQLIDFLTIRRRASADTFFSRYLRITAAHRTAHRAATGEDDAADTAVRRWLAQLDESRRHGVLDERELEALQQGYRERVTDVHLPHVRDLPQRLPGQFGAAALRACAAGFDGIELHYAHAYTMASFLSRLNTRSDGYGGSPAERLRLALEVYRRVRADIGNGYPIGCRMLAEECIDSGSSVQDQSFFAAELAAAGMDFISLSRGGKFEDASQPKLGEAAYPYTGRSGYECMPSYYSDAKGPFGRNIPAAAAVRRAVRARGCATPIVVSGGVHNFEQAEAMLAQGHADMVGLARQALADPDWPLKVRTGSGEAVRLCLYTNYCETLDQRHRQVTCELWDREALDERGVRLSSDGKRRLVAPPWRVESSATDTGK
jgi:2,4-dienoyl-CoA reductase-like NADH-dependent reductase (Old Yellow Enzyme family)